MPTGYTWPIEDNPDYTFERFVWDCARAFGALVLMRDDPTGAPIPKEFQPNGYYEKQLKESQAKLIELEGLTLDQAAHLCEQEHAASVESYRLMAEEDARKLKIYAAMRECVEQWHPPTAQHAELKKFMLQQIDVSTEHMTPEACEVAKPTPAEWLRSALESARRDVAFSAKHWEEEKALAASRTQWVRKLHESVPMPKELEKT